MCEYTQREFGCGHFRFIAARWCNAYRSTHRRCSPEVIHFDFTAEKVCSACNPSEKPAWYHSIRSKPPAVTDQMDRRLFDDCMYINADVAPEEALNRALRNISSSSRRRMRAWSSRPRPHACIRSRPRITRTSSSLSPPTLRSSILPSASTTSPTSSSSPPLSSSPNSAGSSSPTSPPPPTQTGSANVTGYYYMGPANRILPLPPLFKA